MTEPRTETGGPTRTPRSEIAPLIPQARREEVGVEPVLFWDRSGSTLWSTAPGGKDFPDPGSRRYVMSEAMRQLVTHLDNLDTEEKGEQAGGSDDLGGILTFFFGSESSDGIDLNPSNFERHVGKPGQMGDVPWGGGTYIMPAWSQALKEYDGEFGDRPAQERPVHLAMIATDGELEDMDDFQQQALTTAGPHRQFLVMIFGADGDGDPRHSQCLAQYQRVAKQQQDAEPHHKSYIKVVSFDSVTDPAEIAQDAITLIS